MKAKRAYVAQERTCLHGMWFAAGQVVHHVGWPGPDWRQLNPDNDTDAEYARKSHSECDYPTKTEYAVLP